MSKDGEIYTDEFLGKPTDTPPAPAPLTVEEDEADVRLVIQSLYRAFDSECFWIVWDSLVDVAPHREFGAAVYRLLRRRGLEQGEKA